jgi:hypothetical protein
LDNCLIACINKFPNGLSQIEATPLKPEEGVMPSGLGHKSSIGNPVLERRLLKN